MIDLIGVAIGAAIFFAFAGCVGIVFAFFTWLIVPKRLGRIARISVAFLIPIVSAAYIWLCIAFLPGESLFGDIDQPLPNGYVLKALGKMPEYGNIERQNGDLSFDGVQGAVDEIAVSGPLVAGRYCQSCDRAFVQSKALYFLLDTRISKSSEYTDLPSLEAAFQCSTPLVENQYFQSQEARHVWQQRIDHWVMFVPPLGIALLYFAYLIRHRCRESLRAASNLY
jgi:hypothetical protein